MMKKSIGIVGGFGAYATLGFYKRILEEFASESERNYPHIYMDNDFTMPSRTRALLYGEEYDMVVKMIAESLRKMCLLEVDCIVLVCGTAHAFLPDVYKIVPQAKGKVINIIDLLGKKLLDDNCRRALLVAAEGALEKRVYESTIPKTVRLINPGESKYEIIRFFIEAVKQNQVNRDTYFKWVDFVNEFGEKAIVLGCTEFPVLIEKLKSYDFGNVLDNYMYYDPLDIAISKLKEIEST